MTYDKEAGSPPSDSKIGGNATSEQPAPERNSSKPSLSVIQGRVSPKSETDSTPQRQQIVAFEYVMNQHPSTRSIPVEADEAHAAKITPAIGLEHAHKLHDLWLAHQYDEVRDEMFQIRSADQEIRDLIDHAVYSAIMMLQTEHVTVVGIILKLLYGIVENHPVLRKQILGPTLFHSRSTKEIQAEMTAISKTLARLQEELVARR